MTYPTVKYILFLWFRVVLKGGTYLCDSHLLQYFLMARFQNSKSLLWGLESMSHKLLSLRPPGIQSSTQDDLFSSLTPSEVEQLPCVLFWRVDDCARMERPRAGSRAQRVKHLLCKQRDMSLVPQNSQRAWGGSVPMGRQEVKTLRQSAG